VNTFYRVRAPFLVTRYLRTLRPSGQWLGASQVMGPATVAAKVKTGDEVHVLVGGSFVVRKNGEAFAIDHDDLRFGLLEKLERQANYPAGGSYRPRA
jgi:hypothetical protein